MYKLPAKHDLSYLLNAIGPFLGLLLILGVFYLNGDLREYMFTGQNFKLILVQSVIVAIGALGMTMIIVSGGIDLSAGSTVALAGVVAAVLIGQGYPVWLVIGLTLLTGGMIGACNGSIIAGCQMVPFIVTLGMMGIGRGIAKLLANNQMVNVPENPINAIMALQSPREFFPLPTGVWIAVILAIMMIVVMKRTVFGRHIFAIGSNESAARLCGIRVRWNKICIYTLAGAFFGLAGLLQFSRLTIGDPTAAIGMELDIIAAVVIGGASLSGGSGSILGSMIGALIMAILRNGTNQMGWQNYTQEIIIGAVIILAVGIDLLRQRKSGART